MVDILSLPLSPGSDFSCPATSDGVDVSSTVFFTFFDKSLFDEGVQIRVEASVVDLCFIVLFEFVFNGESMWTVKA
ncbi:hypothetical protein SAMN06264867_107134 [Halorubrum cibi]|uniref:Uncharacterized protein n=1 Tax=Halorubrum cibi TaxID=413815 RepID=A0A521DPI2_9EURY|nr:hypothetical protein SAMN06264867_107134 [Halorubrum cibi]